MLKQVQHDAKEGEDHEPVPVGTGLQDDSKKSKSGFAKYFAFVLRPAKKITGNIAVLQSCNSGMYLPGKLIRNFY